jgi:hypothetical protein
VAEYLSSAWVAELDAALRGAPRRSVDATRLVVEQVVSDTPTGELRYHVVIGPEGIRAFAGAARAPDVIVTTSYPAAIGIQRGEVSAQDAIANGQCRVTGDASVLVLVLPALRAASPAPS